RAGKMVLDVGQERRVGHQRMRLGHWKLQSTSGLLNTYQADLSAVTGRTSPAGAQIYDRRGNDGHTCRSSDVDSRRRKAGRMSIERFAMLYAAGVAVALTSTPQGLLGPQGNTDVKKDSAFIRETQLGGLAEAQLGRLAHQKASSTHAKQFGEQVETDHTKVNHDLDVVATAGVLNFS